MPLDVDVVVGGGGGEESDEDAEDVDELDPEVIRTAFIFSSIEDSATAEPVRSLCIKEMHTSPTSKR